MNVLNSHQFTFQIKYFRRFFSRICLFMNNLKSLRLPCLFFTCRFLITPGRNWPFYIFTTWFYLSFYCLVGRELSSFIFEVPLWERIYEAQNARVLSHKSIFVYCSCVVNQITIAVFNTIIVTFTPVARLKTTTKQPIRHYWSQQTHHHPSLINQTWSHQQRRWLGLSVTESGRLARRHGTQNSFIFWHLFFR